MGRFKHFVDVLQFTRKLPTKFAYIQLPNILSIHEHQKLQHFVLFFAILWPISVALSRHQLLGHRDPIIGLQEPPELARCNLTGMRLLTAHNLRAI